MNLLTMKQRLARRRGEDYSTIPTVPGLRYADVLNESHRQLLRKPGMETPGPIQFWRVRHAGHGRALAHALRAAGIYPTWIRYPGGPPAGYFRFALSSAHQPSQIDRLSRVLLQSDGTR